MSDKVWNLATGNVSFMENCNHFPERIIAPYVNIVIRGFISLMWLVLYGTTFDVRYKNGDWVRMFWCNFKYKALLVNTHNGIWAMAGEKFVLQSER